MECCGKTMGPSNTKMREDEKNRIREAGGQCAPSDLICVIKEAARQVLVEGK